MTDPVYKILTSEQAAEFDQAGEFRGAPIDFEDGYIHLSAAHQLFETMRLYFTGKGPLVVIGLSPDAMKPDTLKWELSRGGDSFPHLYDIMTKGMVVTVDQVDEDHTIPNSLKDAIQAITSKRTQ